ncbi:hypothetical protein GCM10010502_43680 [Kitasatospora aureofaciens]|uniref:Uncharacterized protein n=1 Tax=Kitasatospora aureofaciens TaxID=1894 RepID=A0A8H9LUA9_KITAU|nr:hypothetical protein GCM10010502_43680 [Kitasatospora aureofaciens]
MASSAADRDEPVRARLAVDVRNLITRDSLRGRGTAGPGVPGGAEQERCRKVSRSHILGTDK